MQRQKYVAIPIIVQRRNLWCLLFFSLHYLFLLQEYNAKTNNSINPLKERQSIGPTHIFVQGSSNSNPLPPPPPKRRPLPPPPPPPPSIPLNNEGEADDGNNIKKENFNFEDNKERTLRSYDDSEGDGDESGDGLNFGRRRNIADNMRSKRTDYYGGNEMDTDTDGKADMNMYSDNDDYYYHGSSSLPRSRSRPQQRDIPRRRMDDDFDERDKNNASYNEGRRRMRERGRERLNGRSGAQRFQEYDDDYYDRDDDDDLSYDNYRRRRQPPPRLRDQEREQRDNFSDRRERQRTRHQSPTSPDYSKTQWDDRDFDRREMSRRREGRMAPDQFQQQERQRQRRERGQEEKVQQERRNEDEGKKKKSFFSSPFGKAFGTGKSDSAKAKGGNNKSENDFQQRENTETYPKSTPRKPAFRGDKINYSDDDRFDNPNVVDLSRGDDEEKSYNPIDYQFPSKDIAPSQKELKRRDMDDINNNKGGRDLVTLPETGWDDNRRIERYDNRGRPMGGSQYANPRRDAVARYTSTKKGKMKLTLSSSTCGALLGAFIGKSIFGNGKQTSILFAFMFWFMGTFLRNVYGEMVRSVALGLIYLLSRTRDVRKRYRTGVHLRTICRLGGGGRVPFPPILDDEGVENPWRYAPETDDDPDFDMIKSLICMVIIGSFCGGNIPLIPTWMGSTGGAAAFAFMCIGKNARGDLVRTMGMRVVATVGEAIDINKELNVASKVAVVAGRLLDKALILDRKHRIKDRVLRGATWAIDRVSSTVKNVQEDMNEEQAPDRSSRQQDRPRKGRPMER